jgi:hypothetical protein
MSKFKFWAKRVDMCVSLMILRDMLTSLVKSFFKLGRQTVRKVLGVQKWPNRTVDKRRWLTERVGHNNSALASLTTSLLAS